MSYIKRVRIEYEDGEEISLTFNDGSSQQGFVDFIDSSPDTVWSAGSLKLFAKLLRLVENDNLNDEDI